MLRPQYAARRRHELAPLPEYSRTARLGLRGIFRVEPLPRYRLPVDLRRDVAWFGAQSGGVHPQGISRSQTPTGERGRTAEGQGPFERFAHAGLGVLLQPHV